MADLIRWEDNDYGGYLGYAGTLSDPWLFQIWCDGDDLWVLDGTLPGHCARGRLADGTELDALQAKAGELLRQWISSIGAVFPDAYRWQLLKDWLASEIDHDHSIMESFRDYPDDGVTSRAHGSMLSAKRSVLAKMRELEASP